MKFRSSLHRVGCPHFELIFSHSWQTLGTSNLLFPFGDDFLSGRLLNLLGLHHQEAAANATQANAAEYSKQLKSRIEARLVENDQPCADPENHNHGLVDRHHLNLVVVLYRQIQQMHLNRGANDRDYQQENDQADIFAQVVTLEGQGRQQLHHDNRDA